MTKKASIAPIDPCLHCEGQVDTADFKRRLCERLGKPYTPPKLCSACLLAAIMDEPDVAAAEMSDADK